LFVVLSVMSYREGGVCFWLKENKPCAQIVAANSRYFSKFVPSSFCTTKNQEWFELGTIKLELNFLQNDKCRKSGEKNLAISKIPL
jgi:hypothetical protein